MNAIPLTQTRISEIINRLGSFHDLGAETLRQIAAGARQISVRRDETVFRKGEPADSLHIVVSGQIKVYLPMPNGGEKVLALVDRGDSFGVASVWLGEAHAANAVAKSDSHILCLDRHMLLRQARQDCTLTSRLLDSVSRRVLDLLRDLESCTPKSGQQRLACYLLQHRPDRSVRSYDIRLPTTKREIAAKLSLTQETLSRVLRALVEEGAIEMRGRLIRVVDVALLERHGPAGDAVRAGNA